MSGTRFSVVARRLVGLVGVFTARSLILLNITLMRFFYNTHEPGILVLESSDHMKCTYQLRMQSDPW